MSAKQYSRLCLILLSCSWAWLPAATSSTSPSWTGTNHLWIFTSARAAPISRLTWATTVCAARERRWSTWPNHDPTPGSWRRDLCTHEVNPHSAGIEHHSVAPFQHLWQLSSCFSKKKQIIQIIDCLLSPDIKLWDLLEWKNVPRSNHEQDRSANVSINSDIAAFWHSLLITCFESNAQLLLAVSWWARHANVCSLH